MTDDLNELKVTPASEWKRNAQMVTLPSGNVAEIRVVGMISLILSDESGDVPDLITAQLIAQLSGKPAQSQIVVDKSELPRMGGFIKRIAVASMVNPRIAENPDYDAGEIAYDDLSDEDKMFLLNLAMPTKEMATAERFRKGQAAVVEPGANGAEVRAEAKQLPGAGE